MPLPPLLHLSDFKSGFKPPCEQSLLLSSLLWEEENGWLYVNVSSLWSHRSPNVWTDQSSVGFLSNWFSECEHPFIDKPLIIEPAVPSTRLLGLSSKLYPSNKQHMLNKDFSRFMKSLTCRSKSSKWKKGSAKRVVLGLIRLQNSRFFSQNQ